MLLIYFSGDAKKRQKPKQIHILEQRSIYHNFITSTRHERVKKLKKTNKYDQGSLSHWNRRRLWIPSQANAYCGRNRTREKTTVLLFFMALSVLNECNGSCSFIISDLSFDAGVEKNVGYLFHGLSQVVIYSARLKTGDF